jgi:formyl-CoA transferase
MLQAVTGFVARTGSPDDRPLRIHTRNVASMSGMYLATGVMAALLDVDAEGGQHVRVNEEEIGMYPEAAKYREGTDFEQRTRFGDNGEWVGAVPSRTFATKPFGPNDYVYVHVNAKVTSHQVALARAIERPDLLTDPDFATPELRRKNVDKVAEIVSEWMARHTKQQAVAILGGAGVPVGMVNTSEEVLGLDHVLASGMICSVDTAVGPVPVPALPVRLSASKVPLRRGPRLGEHTAEVLGLLGREGEVATLREKGLVR